MIRSNRARKTLVLNKSFFPIRIEQMQQVFVNMSKETYLGLDIDYETNDEGCIQLDKVSSMMTISKWKDWLDLPVREYDDFVHTVRGAVRVPSIVICATFNKIVYPRVLFPTNRNIFKRDNYTCAYTGKKLAREELSVDHIIPRSRGGKNTWENMVCCDRTLNCEKADMTPAEAGLKLRIKPTKPVNGLVFDVLRDEWKVVLDTIQ